MSTQKNMNANPGIKVWMVLRDNGFDLDGKLPLPSAPRFVHSTHDAAEAEAERLSIEFPQDSFLVLEAVSSWHAKPAIFNLANTAHFHQLVPMHDVPMPLYG